MYFEGSALADDLTSRDIVLSNGVAQTDFIRIGYSFNSNNIRLTVFSGNSQVLNTIYNVGDILQINKKPTTYKNTLKKHLT